MKDDFNGVQVERAEAMVNFGMIRSLIGFVGKTQETWGAIMHNQVHRQARAQGIDCDMVWDEAVETNMVLSVPILVVVDIADLIVKAQRSMDEIGENRKTVQDAIDALHKAWNPMVKAALASVYDAHSKEGRFSGPDRLGEIPPESQN